MIRRLENDPEFLKSQLDEGGSRGKVYLTGFGKFNGVEVNPTTILIEKLRESPADDDILYEILDVAVDKVDCFHSSISTEAVHDVACYIHLGVNAMGDCIQLERAAYNNMNFRCADESGFQPIQTQICEDSKLDHPLVSSLPLDDFASVLASEGFNCRTSDDPGRFLCNYVYYKSLLRTPESVFIHVPHFSVIDFETQFSFIRKVTKKIVAYTKLMKLVLREGAGESGVVDITARQSIAKLVAQI